VPALLALSFGFIAVDLWSSSVGRGFDIALLREFFALRGARPVPHEVVLVSIDQQSFTALGLPPRSALPRKNFADVIESVEKAKPKLVIVDASFPAEDLDPIANARIARALSNMQVAIGAGKMNTGLADKPFVTISSDEQFRSVAKMEMSMLFNSVDGITSLLTLDTKPNAALYERTPLAKALVELGKFQIAKAEPMALINFYGPPGTLPRVVMHELVASDENLVTRAREKLADKVILLGYQSVWMPHPLEIDKEEFLISGSHDPMFGVEVHASIVANLIDSSWLKRFDIQTEVAFIFFAAFALGLAGLYLPPVNAAALILGTLILATLANYFAFARYHFWLPAIACLWAIGLLSLLLGVLHRLGHLNRLKRFIGRVFGTAN